MSETPIFEWRGKQLPTYGDLGSVMFDIYKNGTAEDAADFMSAYRAFTEHEAFKAGQDWATEHLAEAKP